MRLPERWITGLLVVAGAALLANPLYLDGLLSYSTESHNWTLGHQFHAAIAALGFVAVLGAVALGTALPDRYGLVETIAAIAVTTVVLYAGYSTFVAGALAPADTLVLGYGRRKTVVASVVAALFVVGGAVGGRSRHVLVGVPLALLAGLGFVALEQGFHAPWVDALLLVFLPEVLLLAVLPDVLGTPFLGTLLYALALLFGGWFGSRYRAPASAGRTVR